MSDIIMKVPQNINELKGCLSLADEKTYILAGGTDLIIKLNKNNIYEGTIIDLTGINELSYIKKEDNFIKIGANSTFTDIAENDIISNYATCLAESASMVGSTQIRNCATLAGNIANASQAADCIPALMCLDARVRIMDKDGNILEKNIDEVIKGINITTLKKDQVIVEIIVPLQHGDYKSAFAKIGSRSTVTISKLNIAVNVKFGQVIEKASVVIGSLGEKAFHSIICEEILLNKKINEDLFINFKETLKHQVDLAIPNRDSRTYKREAMAGIADEIIKKLF